MASSLCLMNTLAVEEEKMGSLQTSSPPQLSSSPFSGARPFFMYHKEMIV
jgi:hypothetical protein